MNIQIDPERREYDSAWNKQNAHLLQSWVWGELKRPAWEPLRVIINDEFTPVGVVSFLVKKMVGIRFGYVPKAIFAKGTEDVWTQLQQYSRKAGLDFVLFEFAQEEEDVPRHIAEQLKYNYHVQPECSNVVDLTRNEDELWLGLKPKYRRNINKAKRDEVVIQMYDQGPHALDDFYDVMEHISANTKYVMQPKEYFAKVWDILSNELCAKIFVAKVKGELAGAYFVACDNTTAYELYGGVNDLGRSTEAGYLLKWSAMLAAKQGGKRAYDHWGVAPRHEKGEYLQNHELSRISSFKAGFGGEDATYLPTRVMINNPLKFKLFQLLNVLQQLRLRAQKLGK